MELEVTFLVIDDNQEIKDHPLLYSIEDEFNNVFFFSNPREGLAFVEENLDKNLIVLLDIQFSKNDHEDGHSMLKQIHEKSSLIPVILWSGINETNEPFSDFINNHAFGFLSKDSSLEEAMIVIRKAYEELSYSLENTLEDWIIQNENDKDKPIYITSDGTSFSLNQILKEVRKQSSIGKSFTQKLNSLTIDLLLRKKEKL